jgi:heme exporter protein D
MVLGVRAPAWTFLMRFVLFVGVNATGYANWFVRAKWGGEFNRASYQALGGYVRFGVTYSLAACVMSLGLLWAYSLNSANRDWLYLAVSLATVLPLFVHSIWQWSVPLHGIHRRKRTHQRFADAVGLVDDASPDDSVSPARPIDYRDQFKAAKYIREIVDNLSGDWSWGQTTRHHGVLRRAKGALAIRLRRRSR